MYKGFGKSDIRHLAEVANASARLRRNYNFHSSHNAPAQHFINYIRQGSIIPFHSHESSGVQETLICLSGVGLFGAIIDNELQVELMAPLNMLTDVDASFCLQIDPKVTHSFVCITKEVILLEVKDGPFCPEQAKDLVEVKDQFYESFKESAANYRKQLGSFRRYHEEYVNT